MGWLRFASRKSLKEQFVTTNVLHGLAFRISTLPFKQLTNAVPTLFCQGPLVIVCKVQCRNVPSNGLRLVRLGPNLRVFILANSPKIFVISWKGKSINILDFLGNSKPLCEKKLHAEAPPGKVLHPDVGLMPKTSERRKDKAGACALRLKIPKNYVSNKGPARNITNFWFWDPIRFIGEACICDWKRSFPENDLESFAVRSSLDTDTLTISSH